MKYAYRGPLSGVNLSDGKEVMLHPDTEVDLPADHEVTKTLLAQGYLAPVATSSAKSTKRDPKGESDAS